MKALVMYVHIVSLYVWCQLKSAYGQEYHVVASRQIFSAIFGVDCYRLMARGTAHLLVNLFRGLILSIILSSSMEHMILLVPVKTLCSVRGGVCRM
jgi:hypothetical protein